MGGQTLRIDIAIIGGGVAGLWALNHLRNLGYSAALFEQEALGSYQTIGSQGMIHGGVKYALAGTWGTAAAATAAMPAAWRRCLAGQGPVDLRGCRILSDGFHLFSGAALSSRLSGFFAGRLMRGQLQQLAMPDFPAPLRSPRFRGRVYRLRDLVLDVPSLVETLAGRQRDAIFAIDWRSAALRREGRRAVLEVGDLRLAPEHLLLTAGAGNEALIALLGSAGPAMQRRPLQQVLVRHEYPEAFYGHCLGGGTTPRLTVSSHRDRAGRPVWYLGGDLASGAAEESPASLIQRARRELAAVFPWLELGATEWATLRLDRAERRSDGLQRPARAFVGRLEGIDNTRVAWPTKLTLCPDLGCEIERQLAADGILPRHRPDLSALAQLPRPPVATPYWETLFR